MGAPKERGAKTGKEEKKERKKNGKEREMAAQPTKKKTKLYFAPPPTKARWSRGRALSYHVISPGLIPGVGRDFGLPVDSVIKHDNNT